jgi:IS30 family transposase
MSYSHLTRDQRCQIESLKSIGYSQVRIAEHVRVSPATSAVN